MGGIPSNPGRIPRFFNDSATEDWNSFRSERTGRLEGTAHDYDP